MFLISSEYPVKGSSPVTWTIIGLCGVVAFLQLVETPSFSEDTLWRFGAFPALVAFDIYPWNADSLSVVGSLFTSMFVHADIWHVVGNMLFFHCFSRPVESLMGAWRYAIFYLLCGVSATVVHSVLNPGEGVPGVGASGAVAGVLAAHTILLPWVRIRLPSSLIGPRSVPAWTFTAIWLFLQFLEPLDLNSTVAWHAHLGGLAAGLLLAPLFSKPGILVMATTPDTEEHWEWGPGYKVGAAPAAAVAGLLVGGLALWIVVLPDDVDRRTLAQGRAVIAWARLTGDVVPFQPESGLALYRVAAADHPPVALMLARHLRQGTLVPKDEAEAVQWFKRAGEGGQPEGVEAYALALIDGNTVSRDAPAGTALLRDLARKGVGSAKVQLGMILEGGRAGEAVDLVRAAELYKEACEEGYPFGPSNEARWTGCYRWSLMLFAGKGGPANPTGAAALLSRAARDDVPGSQNALGLFLVAGDPQAADIGKARTPDEHRARNLFLSAAKRGEADATYNYARLSEQRPEIFPLPPAEIRSWYEKSAAAGSEKAKAILKQQ